MATYPENPSPSRLTFEAEWLTLKTPPTDSGKEQRRQKLLFPRYNVEINYPEEEVDLEQMNNLWDFYMARKGELEPFYVYDWLVSKSHAEQYCGTADGSTAVFDIPGRSTMLWSIYSDGVLVDPADYTILTGGGASNSDRVEYDSNPTAGVIVTADFSGYLRARVRFEDDKLARETFLGVLFSFGIRMKGLSAI